MSLLLLLPSEWLALIAMLLLCGHVVTGLCIRTDVRSVCPAGLHVEGVLVICSRGTRVLVSLGKGEALTYPLGRVPTRVLQPGTWHLHKDDMFFLIHINSIKGKPGIYLSAKGWACSGQYIIGSCLAT
jgi:hypothetical protein